jgi:hypothetical protein
MMKFGCNYQFESLSKSSGFQTFYTSLTFFCHGWTDIEGAGLPVVQLARSNSDTPHSG